VERPLDLLLRCVKRMPATGRLFTSQSPLGPIFLAGLVAVQPVDRTIIRNWFRTVTSKGSKSVRILIQTHPQLSNSHTLVRVSLLYGIS
jgi:hypothetical protein